MTRIAILTAQIGSGYGVSRVIGSQLPYLVSMGYCVDVFACEVVAPPILSGVHFYRIPTHVRGLLFALKHGGYSMVIAHSHPFYRILPYLPLDVVSIAYEHGTPPPELFHGQEQWRLAEKQGMVEDVYARVSQVIAISKFIAKDIHWPKSKILYNGADHLQSENPQWESWKKVNPDKSPLRLLCVSRLGESESLYKGFELLQRLAEDLGKSWNVVLVGKGTISDRNRLERPLLKVVIDISDQELCEYYANSDAVVSFSRWEGFNLPIAEAGFFRVPAFALNYGAHAEVTPFCFDTYEELRNKLVASTRGSLAEDGARMLQFVQRFHWAENGRGLLDILKNVHTDSDSTKPKSLGVKLFLNFLIVREFVRKWRKNHG